MFAAFKNYDHWANVFDLHAQFLRGQSTQGPPYQRNTERQFLSFSNPNPIW